MIISRILGLLFVFPFSRMVLKKGIALYSYAYTPYILFLDLSTLGIPLAISKLIASNDKDKHSSILKSSTIIALALGATFFLTLFFISDIYANYVMDGEDQLNTIREVSNVIKIISLSILISPVVSVIRGYYQGLENMYVTSVSQIIEQVVRVSLILILSYIAVYKYDNITLAIYLSVLSTFIASLSALLMVYIYVKRDKLKILAGNYFSFKKILKYSLPFFYFGISLSLYSVIDTLFFNKALIASNISNSEEYFAIYAFEAKKIVSGVVLIANSFSLSLIPRLIKSKDGQIKTTLLILSIILFINIMVFVLSDFIYNILFGYNELGGYILRIHSILIIIYSINLIINAHIQAKNYLKIIIITQSIAIILKFILTYPLAYNYDIVGIMLSTLIPLAIISIINLLYIYHKNKNY